MASITRAGRAGEAVGLLFDSWFDSSRIEEELTTALSRPRSGRRAAEPLPGELCRTRRRGHRNQPVAGNANQGGSCGGVRARCNSSAYRRNVNCWISQSQITVQLSFEQWGIKYRVGEVR